MRIDTFPTRCSGLGLDGGLDRHGPRETCVVPGGSAASCFFAVADRGDGVPDRQILNPYPCPLPHRDSKYNLVPHHRVHKRAGQSRLTLDSNGSRPAAKSPLPIEIPRASPARRFPSLMPQPPALVCGVVGYSSSVADYHEADFKTTVTHLSHGFAVSRIGRGGQAGSVSDPPESPRNLPPACSILSGHPCCPSPL